MASRRALRLLGGQWKCLFSPARPFASLPLSAIHPSEPPLKTDSRAGRRRMATVSEPPPPMHDLTLRSSQTSPADSVQNLTTSVIPEYPDLEFQQPPGTVITTVFHFPTMEPLHFAYYPAQHLHLPLRKDLLHRAIVYEGDLTRQGTASTKWRSEVRGSHKKLRPQKGFGKARVGDRQSPIRKGGGVAFGPKPRDFSTDLPRKIYDKALRTALSFRYRRGELLVVDQMRNPKTGASYWMKQIFERNGWGNADKRSLLIATEHGRSNSKLFDGVERIGEDGKILQMDDVDVKDLLGMGRLIIEYNALNGILQQHSSDLNLPADSFPRQNFLA